MATIDPNIALGVKPLQIENPMNRYAALSQIQSNEQSNQLNALKMQEMQRAIAEEEGIRNYLSKANLSTPEGKAGLAQFGKTGLSYGKLLTEQEKDAAALKKTTVETTGLEIKQKIEKANKAISDIAALNSPQDALAGIERHLANGDIDQVKADQLKQSIAKAPNFNTWQKTTLVNILDAKDKLHQQYQEATLAETTRSHKVNEGISGAHLGIAQANLAISQEKAGREKTMGTIPAGYRLAADGKSLEAMPGGPTTVALPPKEIQKREATFPQATSAVKAIETKSDSFIKDLETLRKHPGLNQITGLVQGRLPAVTGEGRAAQALYDKIVAKGGFQALQDLRDASKTGGALGNVSNQEGKQLTASFAAIDRRQNAKDVQAAIDQAIDDIKGTKTRVREAYTQTYEYRNSAGANTSNIDALLKKYE